MTSTYHPATRPQKTLFSASASTLRLSTIASSSSKDEPVPPASKDQNNRSHSSFILIAKSTNSLMMVQFKDQSEQYFTLIVFVLEEVSDLPHWIHQFPPQIYT